MFKKISSFVLLMCIMVLFTACSSKQVSGNKEFNKNGKVQVAVSFNPLKEFAQAVGKDKIEVYTIVPNGTEPHDFEPKPRDMETINNADIFVYNGMGMENWADKVLQTLDNKKLVTVAASNGIAPIKNHNSVGSEGNGQYDPHTWLGLKEAKIEANNIKNALIKVDPANKDYYEKNYADFASKIDNLYNDYSNKFTTLTNKNFVTGHAAFAYFCRDFGLKQNSAEDVFAEGEPTAQKLKELVDYCKANKIKVVFSEELASPKVSQTLAREVNAKVEKIYTIESSEDNKDYMESMSDNLGKVYESLK